MEFIPQGVMLSRLIEEAQRVYAEQGDMPVWLELSRLGHDDTERYGGWGTFTPAVADRERMFATGKRRAFILAGDCD